ncbi:Senescence-associated protein osa15 protein [Thalictrum thalictroides]|uniref:Senescence-associated protein osa15 protein n=2 Tax=Thalictrum thalictroides TaxID=46969 RepID=A0A7J6XHA2_THATH|nr:Senescence-associated protein osa15 protein [Thalictrum thalictroides]
MGTNGANITESCRIIKSCSKAIQHTGSHTIVHKFKLRRPSYGRLFTDNLSFNSDGLSSVYGKPCTYVVPQENSFMCHSRGTKNTEAKHCVRRSKDYSDVSRTNRGHEEVGSLSEHTSTRSSQGLAEICNFVYNDVKFVNERARNDMVLLSRGIMKLNDRACQDVEVLSLGFLKLDARAREETEKIDHGVKKKAERLHQIARILQDKAQSKLKSAADKHWNNGALEADLRRADSLAKRRAMEDSFMALEFVKNIHDMMVSKMYTIPLCREQLSADDMMSIILEKNGKTVDFLSSGVSTDRITAIQEAYWSMASALSEADGIDYTDPEELELVVATLIDLDAMDSKRSVSLLAECSSSPDVSTRQALANALTAAPSMWTLGNAGMGALQRLAEDSNPAISIAASKAIDELKKQWKIEEGDSWRFTMNQIPTTEADVTDNNDEIRTD